MKLKSLEEALTRSKITIKTLSDQQMAVSNAIKSNQVLISKIDIYNKLTSEVESLSSRKKIYYEKLRYFIKIYNSFLPNLLSNIEDLNRELNGGKAELEYIENKLKKQNQYINKLYNDKSKKENISDELKLEKVYDSKKILELDKKLKLYYKCGYYYNKLKSYKEDKIDEKINIYFNNNEVQIVKKYIENSMEKEKIKKLEYTSQK